MPVKTRTSRNRKGRMDPSKPKLPTLITVIASIDAGNVVLTAPVNEILQFDSRYANGADVAPGITFDGAAAGTIVIGPANVATISFAGGPVTDGTLSISPLQQSLRNNRGGIVALGQTTFPA